MGSPGSSDIETGIEWNRVRPEAKALLGKVGTQWQLFFMSLSLSLTHSLTLSLSHSLSLFYPYLLGPDMGTLWSQGLEGTSVSIGFEIRKLWKG